MGGGADPWTNWASGVLQGISAPESATNYISLWNWSNKESGANVMRWNNPLNTTESGFGGVDENSVGVKAYPSVFDGIQATVVTLLGGRYPTIVANLRNQVPHQEWQNAAGQLDVWGTGADWLGWTLQPPWLPPAPAPKPTFQEEQVEIFRSSEIGPDGNPLVFAYNAYTGLKRHLTGADYTLVQAAGVKVTDVDKSKLDAIPDAPASMNLSLSGSLSGSFSGKAA